MAGRKRSSSAKSTPERDCSEEDSPGNQNGNGKQTKLRRINNKKKNSPRKRGKGNTFQENEAKADSISGKLKLAAKG